MAVEANAPFLWGAGGRRLTPEEILMERKAASTLGTEAMSTAPVGHWSQGLNRVLQGLMAGYDGYSADQASKQNGTESAAVIQALIGGNAAPATSAAPAVAPVAQAAPVSTPMGATAIPSGAMDPGLRDAISSVATARGIDPAYMTRLAMVESGGNPNAASPLSSAKGPFQFINSTAQQYGLTNPNDPAASADAAARLTLDNKAALTQALGRDPTPGELYLAHQQGAGGAAKLLANPNAPVESIIGQQAAANNGAAPGMTAGQFASKWTGKFSDVGGAAPAPAARPAINPAIVQAISSPYMSDTAKKIGTMLFQNNLEQQQKASDPLRRLQIQEAQGKIASMPLDLRGKQLSNTKAEAELGAIPLEIRSKQLANTKAERDLAGEGAMPLTKDERSSYGIPDGQPAYKTRAGEIKFGPAGTKITNVNGDAETSFSKEAGKVTANRFNDLVADGQKSKQMMSDMTTLLDLGRGIGTGKGAQLKAVLGPYAQAAGIDVTGLPDIQAYEAIVNRVAPSLRVAGSGAQSDYELKNFLKSIPSLGNTQEGNELATAVMTGLTQNKVQAAEISSRALAGEITRTEAEKQLRELPDPMKPYTEYKQRKTTVDGLLQKYGTK